MTVRMACWQALLYDAALVPVLAFGETDVYDVEHWPWAEALQARMQKLLGFAVPVFHGRGIFNYDFGLLPYRRPIAVVVGAPLELRRVSAAGRRAAELGERWLTRDEEGVALVDEWHAAYVEAVRGMYEEHKAKLFMRRVSSMRIS
jgi:2-acylglycerol O-acyltransferase 2